MEKSPSKSNTLVPELIFKPTLIRGTDPCSKREISTEKDDFYHRLFKKIKANPLVVHGYYSYNQLLSTANIGKVESKPASKKKEIHTYASSRPLYKKLHVGIRVNEITFDMTSKSRARISKITKLAPLRKQCQSKRKVHSRRPVQLIIETKHLLD